MLARGLLKADTYGFKIILFTGRTILLTGFLRTFLKTGRDFLGCDLDDVFMRMILDESPSQMENMGCFSRFWMLMRIFTLYWRHLSMASLNRGLMFKLHLVSLPVFQRLQLLVGLFEVLLRQVERCPVVTELI